MLQVAFLKHITSDMREKSDVGSVENGHTLSHLLADVLSSERTAARTASEARDVPLSLQSQQRLSLFDLLAAACTV